jgi:NAD-dependent deacetylase
MPRFAGANAIITLSIDPLHDAAGTRSLIHMHGELLQALCALCEARRLWVGDLDTGTVCSACGKSGGMRPDVVWFGEMPYEMDRIYELLSRADLFLSIGTSGNVYPAAGLVAAARENGAHTVELNLEPSEGAGLFREAVHGPATQIVPAFVEWLLRT